MMALCARGIGGGLRARLVQRSQGARTFGSAPRPTLSHLFSQRVAAPQRGLAFKPREGVGRKGKVDVKEADAPAKEWWQAEQPASQLQRPSSDQQPYYDDQRARGTAPGSQFDSVTAGVSAHLQKVYATLCAGIGVAAGASMVSMATGLAAMIPAFVPGILALAPMVYLLSYTNKFVRAVRPAERSAA